MKSLCAAVLTAGLLCTASSASAFELLSNLGFGGYGCGCEPSCGPVQKGCCATPVQKDCGPVQKGCDRGCHRDRCHRSCFSFCNRGCCPKVPSCSAPVQAPIQKGGDCCHRDRCHRDRCHRSCLSGLFSNWGGCGCQKTCGCEPACGYDKGPIQK